MGGDSGGCAHDARTNGVPESHGNTKTDAQNTKELGFWRYGHEFCSLIVWNDGARHLPLLLVPSPTMLVVSPA